MPSLVRFPFKSYLKLVPPDDVIRFDASYDALVIAEGIPVRAQLPPTPVRLVAPRVADDPATLHGTREVVHTSAITGSALRGRRSR